MKETDTALYIIVFLVLAASASWLFYDSFFPVILFAPLSVPFLKMIKRYKKKKYTEELSEGFIRALISVSTSLAAGMSPENAFIEAGRDMEKLFGKTAPVTREMEEINKRVRCGRRLKDALFELAARSKVQQITDFAQVFAVASEKGADFPAIISSCVYIMEEKMRSENEARVMIRARQYEQRVMCIIPWGILLYLRISSKGFIEQLYHSVTGAAVMTVCLIVYVSAVILSEKIGDVRV